MNYLFYPYNSFRFLLSTRQFQKANCIQNKIMTTVSILWTAFYTMGAAILVCVYLKWKSCRFFMHFFNNKYVIKRCIRNESLLVLSTMKINNTCIYFRKENMKIKTLDIWKTFKKSTNSFVLLQAWTQSKRLWPSSQ